MTVHEARRCIAACADYLRRVDGSPRAANDLHQAARAFFAEGVRQARLDSSSAETADDLIDELWGR